LFGSEMLEVAIGVVFVYLLLSLLCSVLSEEIARLLAMRSGNLEAGIRNLLNDPYGQGLAGRFYGHPLIKGLAKKGWFDQKLGREGRPSYIPSRNFALALMDIVAPADPNANPRGFSDVREAVAKLSDGAIKKSLLVLLDEAEGDLKKARENIENWFDDAMDRVAGWYKRKAQLIISVIGLLITVALNADTFMIANSLWRDTALRASIVAAAEETAKKGLTESDKVGELQDQLQQLSLPIGWLKPSKDYEDPREPPSDPLGWFYKIFGLLVTAFAISLGAPFWFDLLNKIINLRGAGKKLGKMRE
jgi:hypothetical protein